ncbi:MAG: type II toxin-antitoxin system VapC family toxin, partial [Acidobacteria bacterium]|nr:type II toxin-antitoxin system VapC family toxin [Acidobacteriota bacterium]
RRNVVCHGVAKARVVEALRMTAASGRVSFTDALLWAVARQEGSGVATFDRAFPKEGIRLVDPGVPS